jgi:hypothetical protein
MSLKVKLLMSAVPLLLVSLGQNALRRSMPMWISIARLRRNVAWRRCQARGAASGFSAAALLLACCGGAACAQGIITGGISGSVVDPTGAAIANASIKVVSDGTGTTFQVTSNTEGRFQLSDVPLGTYTVTISATGFGQDTVSHVQVVAGNITSMGKESLSLGTATQSVEVEAGAAELMNTESSQGEVIVDSAQLQTLPVNGAFDNVTLMVPGVVQTHGDAMSNTNGANFSVNGERGRANNSEIDGQSNNDNSIGGPSFFFSNQDSLQEIEVITTDFGAQYGRNMGSVVNYITKTGTNTFHGTGFEYYTGSFLSSLLQYQKDPQFGYCPPGVSPSTGCTPVTVPRFVLNNYGGTLGGPIWKDKLFFFGSTFWAHEYQAGALDTSGGNVFPDANGLKQLQADYPNNPGVAAMVLSGPYSVANGNPAPQPGTTTTVPVTDGSTIQNIEMAGVERTLAAHVLDQEELGRLDYQMTPRDRLYLRYDYQNNPWIPAWYLYFNAGIAAGGYSQVSGITHQVGGDWTHTFTPKVINQLRYAFQQSTIGFVGGGQPTCTITDFSPCSSIVNIGAGAEGFGYGYLSFLPPSFPQGRIIKVNQVQDNGTWNLGRHTLMFGGEFDHQDSPNGYLPNAEGTFNFTPLASNPLRNISSNSALNNGFTGMLEGVGTLQLTQGSPTIPFKEPDYALYFQDDWKIMSNLTLNLGLRYEFFSQSVNLLHDESFAQQTGSHPFWSTSLPLSATTFPKIDSSYRNVEPRVGLAYTPDFARKMVVHAGFAINVDPEFYNIFLNLATAAPVVNAGIVTCNGIKVNCEPAGGFTFATVQAADDPLLPTGGDPRVNPFYTVPTSLHNPMAETYTLGLQYQLFPAAVVETRYVGNHTFGQFQSLNTNPDILDVQSSFPNYGSGTTPCTTATAPGYTRPNCDNFLIETVGNTAFSIYNSLQSSLTIRDFHHWTGTASYTYSRTIDNTSEINSTASGGNTSAFAQNPLDSDIGERGVSGNSYPNVWGIQMAYNEPWYGRQSGILGRVLGGYFFNAFYQYNGGQPFSPIQNGISVQSSAVQSDVAGKGSISPTVASKINPLLAENSFCDAIFASDFGNPCRPILSNPRAPLSSIGINLGPGGYVDYLTGVATPASSEHWLWNNRYEAIARNNPFPGVGRNTLRGDSFNNLDLTVGKNVKINERINMILQVSAFNVMNRAYYGTPDPNVEDSSFGGFLSSFYAYNTSAESSAAGGAYEQGFGNRNVELGAKIVF